jgi:hypothetical protein
MAKIYPRNHLFRKLNQVLKKQSQLHTYSLKCHYFIKLILKISKQSIQSLKFLIVGFNDMGPKSFPIKEWIKSLINI